MSFYLIAKQLQWLLIMKTSSWSFVLQRDKKTKRILAWPSLTTSKRSRESWLRTSSRTKSWRKGTRRLLFPRASWLKCEKKKQRSYAWPTFSKRCTRQVTLQLLKWLFLVNQLSSRLTNRWWVIRTETWALCILVQRVWAFPPEQQTHHRKCPRGSSSLIAKTAAPCTEEKSNYGVDASFLFHSLTKTK